MGAAFVVHYDIRGGVRILLVISLLIFKHSKHSLVI